MSVRRLAPEAVQPKEFTFTAENADWTKGQIAKYPPGRQASAVIPLLWKAQEQVGGWTPRRAIEEVAAMLGLPYIRVLEIATFYTMFNLAPVGRYHVQLCGTVPCHVCGALELKKICEERIGQQGEVTADGKFSWLEVECLGACCNAPMVQINYDYYEDLDPTNFGKLLDDLAAGRPVKTGSQTGRMCSEPLGGATTLADPSLYDGSRVGGWKTRFEETGQKEKEETGEQQPVKSSGEGGPAVPGSRNEVHIAQPASPKGLGVAPAGSPAGNAASPDEAVGTSKKPGNTSPRKR